MNSAALRNIAGLIRLATAAAIIYAIAWQVEDRLIHNVFRPHEYFAFFTIDSAMITAVTLAVTGYRSIKGLAETELLAKVRLTVVSVEVVVCVVYNLLLRGGAPDQVDAAAGYTEYPVVPNEILHVWAPIIVFLDFVLLSQVHLKLKQALSILIYPVAWSVMTIIKGIATNWWPYWFIDPNDKGGIPQMIEYIFAIMIFMLVTALLCRGLARLVRRG